MCEMINNSNGKPCTRVSRYFVHVATTPQILFDGSRETSPAGRSIVVCTQHLTRAVDDLAAITIKRYGAAVQVRDA